MRPLPYTLYRPLLRFENIVQRRLRIEANLLSHEASLFIEGLLTVKVEQRLGCEQCGGPIALRKHSFFERNGIDTDALLRHGVEPPFVPKISSPSKAPLHSLHKSMCITT